MNAYLALARASLARQFRYRGANLAGLITNFFFGVIRVSVMVALYNANPAAAPAGYDLAKAVTYLACAQAIIGWVALWGWWDLVRALKGGEVVADLQRPIDFFGLWAAQDFGRAIAQLFLRAIPIMLAFALVYPLVGPADIGQLLIFILSFALAWFLSFTWRFLFSILGFWVTDGTGFARLAIFSATFFTGFLMPLSLFPDALAGVLRWLPFAGMVATPLDVFSNALRGPEALVAVAVQVFWALALYALAQATFTAGVRRLTTQGG